MTNQRKHGFIRALAMLMAVLLTLSVCPLGAFAEDTVTTNGDWTITNSESGGVSSGVATYGDLGFTYYSPTTVINSGSSNSKNYVASTNTNGLASDGIVSTSGSYCDYTAARDGTLTVYVGNASTKTGYVSKTDAEGNSTAIGTYVPGGTGSYDADGFTVTQGTSWATLNIEVEKGSTYYINVYGSKMKCYGAEFVAYTNVTGTITDSFNLSEYLIKFTNTTTRESKMAAVTGNTYSILLKPGYKYSASLTGSLSTAYAVSSDTRSVEVEVKDEQTADLTIVENVSYIVSGSLSGIASGYDAADMALDFVPEDTDSFDTAQAELDLSTMTYKAQLVANESYTAVLTGVYDYELADTYVLNYDDDTPITQDIAFKAVDTYDVKGGFLGLTQVRGEYESLDVTPSSITFTNVDDGYVYNGTVSDGSYAVALRDGSYQAAVTADGYSTTTHVVVNGGAVERDLLLKADAKAVDYADTLYVGSDKAYKSVQSAVDAVANMTRTDGQRVTIKLDPGVYREQVVVNTPNITLESNGGTRDNTKITWYYGIGYKYYSCVDSYYDPYADYDKFEKGNVISYWGSAVITKNTAKGFRAQDITFENSFNKYMTDEEIEDGVEVNGLESIQVVRKENTNVDDRASTERAAALVNYADQVEFNSCAFIGSQDTLYTCNVAYDSYYKNCYIEGQTDFIYGNGDVIFDGCEINFCGYDGTKNPGYLTANSCSQQYPASDGYIFRSCYISYNDERDVTAGYLGRMWGDSAKVAFINTQLQQDDMIVGDGWTAMSSNSPTSVNVTLKEYNTTYNGTKIDTSSRVNGAVDTIDDSAYTVSSVFINNGWTPAYYTAESASKPEFDTNPLLTSNGDINLPNPGETLTLGYSLGDEWADEDASRIAWYAVDGSVIDETDLDTILASSTLLAVSSASAGNSYQIPMECSGYYIMAVVTPITYSGLTGTAEYILDKSNQPVSGNWSDPSDPGSIAPGSGINIYLAGDSTVKDYSANGMYNSGKIQTAGSWGEFLQDFFNEKYVTVNDIAQGGRSSRSFFNEGKLDTIIDNIKSGDYLFIQFGHNDCSNEAAYYLDRFVPLYTQDTKSSTTVGDNYPTSNFPTIKPVESMKTATPSSLTNITSSTYYAWDCGATYKGFLQEYIDEALEKGAIPVIVTPVARQYYDSNGKIKTHHDAKGTDYDGTKAYLTENNAYVTACKELYEENKDSGVLLLDAYQITVDMYEAAYEAGGSAYGTAVMDNGDSTHSNKTGGVIQAGYIAKWIQDADISISPYVKQPTSVYGEETSGDYIFTIDKDGTFTAKDKSLTEQPYWSKVGQAVFDSIGGKEAAAKNEVTLNFATDDALALYETNADSTFTDGEYAGEYTNESGQAFDTVVYQDGVLYYANTASYGTKIMPNKPVFSFVADKAANYKVTVAASTSNGGETVGLYTDAACTNAVATATVTDRAAEIVYKKSSADSETLYFATTDAGNTYVKEFTVSYEVPKSVILNFGTDEAMKLYETNADSTFTDGEYAGEYTNESGQVFDAVVYENAILYYSSTAFYGTKAVAKVPVFSFTADEKAMYTITVSAGTGSGTIGLYSDAGMTNELVSGTAAPGTIVYKKKTADAEKVYFIPSESNNMYISNVTIEKSELPQETKINFKGAVDGIEKDDTNVVMTLKASTETVTVTADDYESTGVELIENENYEITAKGDKGVYTGSITTDDSGQIDISLSRIHFEFPLDFMENYDDYKIYLDAMGSASGNITDPYSNITVYQQGIVQSDNYRSYGVKTNSKSIISFPAEKTGICTVSVNVSTFGSTDKLILKVNDNYAPVLRDAATGTMKLSVIAEKGDIITIYDPNVNNFWYKDIDVSYTSGEFLIENYDADKGLLYGSISKDVTDDVEAVGFYLAAGEVSSLDEYTVFDESTSVFKKIEYDGESYTAANDDNYVFGTALTDIDSADKIVAYAFCRLSDGTEYYSAPIVVKE